MVISVTGSEMRDPVPDLQDLLQLRLPKRLRWQVRREAVPVLPDQSHELAELRIAQRVHLPCGHVRQALVRVERACIARQRRAPAVAEQRAQFDIDNRSQPGLELPQPRVETQRAFGHLPGFFA